MTNSIVQQTYQVHSFKYCAISCNQSRIPYQKTTSDIHKDIQKHRLLGAKMCRLLWKLSSNTNYMYEKEIREMKSVNTMSIHKNKKMCWVLKSGVVPVILPPRCFVLDMKQVTCCLHSEARPDSCARSDPVTAWNQQWVNILQSRNRSQHQ